MSKVYSPELEEKIRNSTDSYCTKCEVIKPKSEFGIDERRIGGVKSWCKKCHSKYNTYSRRMRDTGFTHKEYTTLLEKQKGKCAICNQVLGTRLHADHNHRTGQKRGLICGKCNFVIGNADEDIEILEAVIEYLKKWNGD